MRVIKVQSGSSCWKLDMEPIPRFTGWLVQADDTVRFYPLNSFEPLSTDEVKLVDKLELEPALRGEVDYLEASLPLVNNKRDCNRRNRGFNSLFNH